VTVASPFRRFTGDPAVPTSEGMATMPSWTDAAWTERIDEPFRSDGEFWSGLASITDALISLAVAALVAVILTMAGAGVWAVLPFVVPVVLFARAGRIASRSSRRNRASFDDPRAWRDAERTAVATAFVRVLGRRRSR
jgi:hypothetical protein